MKQKDNPNFKIGIRLDQAFQKNGREYACSSISLQKVTKQITHQ